LLRDHILGAGRALVMLLEDERAQHKAPLPKRKSSAAIAP
jgi:hypothetical protein